MVRRALTAFDHVAVGIAENQLGARLILMGDDALDLCAHAIWNIVVVVIEYGDEIPLRMLHDRVECAGITLVRIVPEHVQAGLRVCHAEKDVPRSVRRAIIDDDYLERRPILHQSTAHRPLDRIPSVEAGDADGRYWCGHQATNPATSSHIFDNFCLIL